MVDMVGPANATFGALFVVPAQSFGPLSSGCFGCVQCPTLSLSSLFSLFGCVQKEGSVIIGQPCPDADKCSSSSKTVLFDACSADETGREWFVGLLASFCCLVGRCGIQADARMPRLGAKRARRDAKRTNKKGLQDKGIQQKRGWDGR